MKKLSFTFLFILITLLQTHAEVRFVSKTGSSTAPYTSWATAADSIQKAINICNPGDTVYVGSGVYQDTVRMTPGIALIGSGIDSCVIDVRKFKAQKYSAITMQDSCTVENFRIIVSNGHESEIYGCGIGASNCKLTIKNNMIIDGYYCITTYLKPNSIIENNFISGDVGISLGVFIFDTKITINNNYFYCRNTGIQLNYGSKPLIKNNIIRIYNNGIGYNMGTTSDTASLYNNLFICDSCWCAVLNLWKAQVVNNVITGKYFKTGMFSIGRNRIINNIINSQNCTSEISYLSGNPPSQVSFNNVYGSKNLNALNLDSTNMIFNPMFTNPDSLDFHLQKYSPLIDSGDPSIKDIDGTRSDIGLYGGSYGESYSYLDKAPRPPVNVTLTGKDNITINWNKNTEADFKNYVIYKSDKPGFSIDTSERIAILTDTSYTDKVNHNSYYKVTAVDNQGNESKPGEEAGYIITSLNEIEKQGMDYKLFNNYPNPFNPKTKISYRIKERGYVKLTIYDIKGSRIGMLLNEEKEAGYYETEFDPMLYGNLASGIYLCRIDVKNSNNIPAFTCINKLIYLK